MTNPHESLRRGAPKYVRGEVHTNVVANFRSMLERERKGIPRQGSLQHHQREVNELAVCSNMRAVDASPQVPPIRPGMAGKTLG